MSYLHQGKVVRLDYAVGRAVSQLVRGLSAGVHSEFETINAIEKPQDYCAGQDRRQADGVRCFVERRAADGL
jgi:hypothetical protein